MNYQRWPLELNNEHCLIEQILEEVGLYEFMKNAHELHCQWIENGKVCDAFVGYGKETDIGLCHLHKYGQLDFTLKEF